MTHNIDERDKAWSQYFRLLLFGLFLIDREAPMRTSIPIALVRPFLFQLPRKTHVTMTLLL